MTQPLEFREPISTFLTTKDFDYHRAQTTPSAGSALLI